MGTIAEKFINEGMQQGIQQGIQQGLQKAIEIGLEIKFGNKGLMYAQKFKTITDIQKLQHITDTVKDIKNLDELNQLLN